jgi:hypothetical protein
MHSLAAPAAAAVLSAVWVAFLMWRADYFEDEHGAFDVNRAHVVIVLIASLGGLVAGAAAGLLPGLAIVAAVLNVVYGMLLAWGLSGGDGEAANPLVGVLSLAVFASVVYALVTALRAGADPTTRTLVVTALPPALVLLACVLVAELRGPRQMVFATAPLVVPPALLAAAAG